MLKVNFIYKFYVMIWTILLQNLCQIALANCDSQAEQTAYNEGYEKQAYKLTLLWETSGNCRQINEFIRESTIDFDSSRDQNSKCRNSGYSDGYLGTLSMIVRSKCLYDCLEKGESIGMKLTEQYCRMSGIRAESLQFATCNTLAYLSCFSTVIMEARRRFENNHPIEPCGRFQSQEVENFAASVCRKIET